MRFSLLSLSLFFALCSSISDAKTEAEKRADACTNLMATFQNIVQKSVFEGLSKLHPNRQIKIKLLLPTARAVDRSSASSRSAYIPLLTRLSLNRIKVIEMRSVGPETSEMIIQGNAKSLVKLFLDLENQEKLTGEEILIQALLTAPLSPVDSTDLEQVKEAKARLLYSDYMNFSGFGGIGIGQGSQGKYKIIISVISGLEGPSHRISTFEGVEIEYRERGEASAY